MNLPYKYIVMKRVSSLLTLLLLPFIISAQDLVWHNPQAETFFTVGGQAWPSELKGTYNRFPSRCETIVRKDVWNLSLQSAGLYLKFKTDSPTIKVRFGLTGDIQMTHMPATGVSGMDLYSIDRDGKLRWYGTGHQREFRDTSSLTYSDLSYFSAADGYEFTLYLPLYNHVEWMEVGVEKTSFFEFLPVPSEKAIVCYGTSIAQGACATRPGMAWTNIIQRELQKPVINLGFSGNGQMEPEVFTILSEINAEVFVIDCMANMGGDIRTPLIYERTMNGIHILREKTNAPIILVEHAGFSNSDTSEKAIENFTNCNTELEKAYCALLQEGVKDLYLIPHSENAYGIDEMVEGWHPNDIGMQHQAAVTEKYIHIATHK